MREAALRLPLRHGVANVTVEQIATELAIAVVRTFFNDFGSKEEAIVAAAAAGAEALIAKFRARPRTEPAPRALRQAVLAVLDRDDEATRACILGTWLITRSPPPAPHQLGALAAQERALADAITERLGLRAAGGVYLRLRAATAPTALRVALHDCASTNRPRRHPAGRRPCAPGRPGDRRAGRRARPARPGGAAIARSTPRTARSGGPRF